MMPAVDWSAKFSAITKLRPPNGLKKLCAPFLGNEEMVLLGGGLPNPGAMPFCSLRASFKDGTEVEISEKKELGLALQYNGAGLKALREWARGFIKHYMKPIAPNWDVMLTAGSSDALEKVFSLLIDKGDIVLTEDHTYTAALSNIKGNAGSPVGVPADGEGIIPNELEVVCARLKKSGKTIKAVYLVPVGANPSGFVMSKERCSQIYKIAQKYNFLVLEDCAYDWIQYSDDLKSKEVPGLRFSGFTPLDVDGRVIRFDTVSKFIAPGLRCGWVTSAQPFSDELSKLSSLSTQTGSAVCQSIVFKLLTKWGKEGLEKHVRTLQGLYQERRNLVANAFQKHLQGLAEWRVPNAGMFFWFKPTFSDTFDSEKALPFLLEHKVLIVPGGLFKAEDDGIPSPWFRLSISFATHEALEQGVKKIADVLRDIKENASAGPREDSKQS